MPCVATQLSKPSARLRPGLFLQHHSTTCNIRCHAGGPQAGFLKKTRNASWPGQLEVHFPAKKKQAEQE